MPRSDILISKVRWSPRLCPTESCFSSPRTSSYRTAINAVCQLKPQSRSLRQRPGCFSAKLHSVTAKSNCEDAVRHWRHRGLLERNKTGAELPGFGNRLMAVEVCCIEFSSYWSGAASPKSASTSPIVLEPTHFLAHFTAWQAELFLPWA